MRTDVLVVGSGIAGCSAAIRAVEEGADVTVVTEATRPDDTNTGWAQGGVAKRAPGERAGEFVEDVLDAGAGEGDEDAVKMLVEEGTEVVEEFLVDKLGVGFDTDGGKNDEDDEFDLAREGGHSRDRVLHKGDATGHEIQVALLRRLAETDARVLEAHTALELVTGEDDESESVEGALVVDNESGEAFVVEAGATILATGGIGDIYGRTTNPPGATGDGVAMAALAGARLDDMEFVQFHPTAHAERGFLLSEALRGEGALLVADGERFMEAYDDRMELAPRDIVATAVHETNRGSQAYLDLNPVFEKTDFENEFPTAYENLTDEELETGLVPVAPAEHFLCGGVVVDENGSASVEGLYAAGETACTGVHGANRLASTSLLEGLTWGLRAGEHVAEEAREPSGVGSEPDAFNGDMPQGFVDAKFEKLQSLMWENVGPVRDERSLRETRTELQRLRGEVKSYARGRLDPELYALRNAVVVGLLITEAALHNKETVGCHRRKA
ncbi:MAG: FAD-dependent oxidoreductase [Halobacteriales archaeon]|nr:FAD-dependent oxidoreductase [Halobacteriales archaeon]